MLKCLHCVQNYLWLLHEWVRNLNLQSDIEIIVNKSNAVKKIKKDASNEGRDLTEKEKKEISEEEKEYKSKRKQIQEKLIKFATRILSLCILQIIANKFWKMLSRNLNQDFSKELLDLK